MLKRFLGVIVFVSSLIFLLSNFTYADPLKSSHYEIDESLLGGSGLTNESSPNFQGASSIGDIAVGNSSSTNFQINSGFNTTSDPTLAFVVNAPSSGFGSFSAATASYTTSTFTVADYTSYGYVVQIVGNTPNLGSHYLTAMSTTGTSTAGAEQFGINLVANTSPASFGANPAHGLYAFGSATSNYGTANNFRFVSGETIASSPKSSGVTTYTISYIANVSSLTPGGQYSGSETLVCTGTY